MVSHINSAWAIDRHDITQGDSKRTADGATGVGIPLATNISVNVKKYMKMKMLL